MSLWDLAVCHLFLASGRRLRRRSFKKARRNICVRGLRRGLRITLFCFSCLTWRFESRAQHTGQCAPRSLPARLGELSPTSARRPRAHRARRLSALLTTRRRCPQACEAERRPHSARGCGERDLLAADAINRRASAPRRRSAGEVLGHPRAAVRAAADLCAARILFVIRACAV